MSKHETKPGGLRQLANPWVISAIYLVSLVILLRGAMHAPYSYDDPRLVAGFWITESLVAVMLLVATWLFFPVARVGLRWPTITRPLLTVPLLLLVSTAVGVWLYVRLTLNPAILLDNILSLKILRTSLLVGISEELMYRGILLAALSYWLGLRRAALLSLLLFGALHLFNIISGMILSYAVMQFLMTMLIGATLVLTAIGSRTVILPMLAHGIYDFCVIDTISSVQAGAPGWPIFIVSIMGIVCGLFSLVWIFRIKGDEPYPDSK